MTALLARFRGIVATVAAPPAFSPASLFASGEEGAWYDPSPTTCFTDTGGTTPASVGDSVAYLEDLSGNGNHATQATASARPTLQQTAGGLYYLDFDGVDDRLITATTGQPNTDKAQVFVGLQNNTQAVFGVLFEYGNTGAIGGFAFFVEDDPFVTLANYTGHAQARFPANYNQNTVLTSLHDRSGTTGALSELSLRVDGVLSSGTQTAGNANSSGNFSANPINIGYRSNNSLPFLGNIYSLIIRFAAAPNATTIDNTESYLAAKSGVTL